MPITVAAKRIAAGDGAKVAEDPSTQVVAAEAAALIDEAKLVLQRNFDELMAAARTGADMPVDRACASATTRRARSRKCVRGGRRLFTASGGRAIFLNSPLLRYFLDVHAARAHYANNPDKPGATSAACSCR
jgi:3-hydroxy-9,10-secoandrosta-1,3,5(10)-triene-9,17-dione monooxygenase